jgi:CO/xanthine dehydrogenase FAD-binding subunit
VGLPPLDYHRPRSLEEAVELLSTLGDDATILAGGTDLIPQLRRAGARPRAIVDIGQLTALRAVDLTDNRLRIGALATHEALATSDAVLNTAPELAAACRAIAAPPVRNRGTIGGNLANASPAADTAPPLLALDAKLHLASGRGKREVAIADFFVGPGETRLQRGELITAVSIEPPAAPSASVFLKYGKRNALAIAVVSVAVRVTLADDRVHVSDVRIALGSVAPTPMRAHDAERLLCGTKGEPGQIAQAAKRAAEATQPITDIRATADYRRLLTSVLVERAVTTALERARTEGEPSCTECTST